MISTSTRARMSGKLLAPLNPDAAFYANGNPRIVSIYAYWNERRGDRPMPRREDIDPVDLTEHLPGIILIDVEGEDARGATIFRYRVVGTREVANRHRDPTGERVEIGYFAESAEAALLSYESVRMQKAAIFEPISFVSDGGVRIEEDSILLPLSENGGDVSQILVYSESLHDEGAIPLRPYTTGSRTV